MKDIQRVLLKKRAQYAQLAKEIELLQQAEQTLREVAPLLAEADDEDDSAILTEVDEGNRQPQALAASATAASSSHQEAFPTPVRGTVPRWP